MNTKLHAVTNADGRPIRFFMTTDQVSDYTGAAALLGSLPKAEWLLADRGYDADWFREALKDKGIRPCMKLLGQRLIARDFDHQVADLQVRVAVLNRYTALGIPFTEAVG